MRYVIKYTQDSIVRYGRAYLHFNHYLTTEILDEALFMNKVTADLYFQWLTPPDSKKEIIQIK